MKRTTKQRLLLAAITGLMGAGAQGTLKAQEPLKDGEVKCYGVNSCGAHAKCAVSDQNIASVRKLLGDKQFKMQYGKSQAHSCGAHAKCGSASKILNWVPATAESCTQQGGIQIDDSGIARK